MARLFESAVPVMFPVAVIVMPSNIAYSFEVMIPPVTMPTSPSVVVIDDDIQDAHDLFECPFIVIVTMIPASSPCSLTSS